MSYTRMREPSALRKKGTMKEIELGTSGLRSAPLGFGCAALLGRSGRSDSLRALAAAWDEGIRFFDTARAYGYGESEALLGEFLRGRRNQAVIATKFGILPARQSAWKQVAKAVARKILAVAPSSLAILRKGTGTQFTQNQFTVPVLKQSIETSLRKLGTEHVDMLFLHAAPASVLAQNDLMEAMGRLVDEGKVRIAGLSAEPNVVALALERKIAPLTAMQFPCNVFSLSGVIELRPNVSSDSILIANHPFGGVARVQKCREVLHALSGSQKLDAALREKLRSADDSTLADAILNVILLGTGIHVVVPAMMRAEHIRTNVSALRHSRFDFGEIQQIREVLLDAMQKGRTAQTPSIEGQVNH
jgi:aryl-alcohol dehydrogenase-like predicted oxidoreductase